MNYPSQMTTSGPDEISALIRGETEKICAWSKGWSLRRLVLHLGVILLGAGCYGAAMGWWRDPVQGLFVAVKFPLIILLTTAGNALIHAMLAPLLGLNISFRQSLSAMVMSFAITSAILGAFSPLIAFVIWNVPPMSGHADVLPSYNLIKLAHVAIITFAGTTGNTRLFQLLEHLGGSRVVAGRVLVAWLAGNFFLGSQLAWILRPFIGTPTLPVAFYRHDALQGNFYESVIRTLMNLWQHA